MADGIDDEPQSDAPPEPAAPEPVTITAEDLERYQAAVARLEEIDAAAAKARAEAELTAEREAHAAEVARLRGDLARRTIDEEIRRALDGRSFVGDDAAANAQMARDLIDLFRPRLAAAQDDAGRWRVTEKDAGRPAADALAEWLKARTWLFRATAQGGANGGGDRLPRRGDSANDRPFMDRSAWLRGR
jgi:hypothetical protein